MYSEYILYVDEFYIVHYVASPKLKEEYNIVRLGVVGEGGGRKGGQLAVA